MKLATGPSRVAAPRDRDHDCPPPDGIVWLASYPKSGNTWLRAFLENVHGSGAAQAGLELALTGIASDRRTVDYWLGIDSAEAPDALSSRLRPAMYECIAAERAPGPPGSTSAVDWHDPAADWPVIKKAHDAWHETADGTPLYPSAATRCAVYVLRDPRDVAVSFAHHFGCTYDAAIDAMADPSYTLAARRPSYRPQLPQRLGDWSCHVSSWAESARSEFPVTVVRYEDMHRSPKAEFTRVLAAIGVEVDEALVGEAIAASSFPSLASLEAEAGFRERPAGVPRFFRRGVVGGWREELDASQAARVTSAHGATMEKYGYLEARS